MASLDFDNSPNPSVELKGNNYVTDIHTTYEDDGTTITNDTYINNHTGDIIQNNTSIREDLDGNSGISISYKDGYNNDWSTTITYDWEGDL